MVSLWSVRYGQPKIFLVPILGWPAVTHSTSIYLYVYIYYPSSIHFRNKKLKLPQNMSPLNQDAFILVSTKLNTTDQSIWCNIPVINMRKAQLRIFTGSRIRGECRGCWEGSSLSLCEAAEIDHGSHFHWSCKVNQTNCWTHLSAMCGHKVHTQCFLCSSWSTSVRAVSSSCIWRDLHS